MWPESHLQEQGVSGRPLNRLHKVPDEGNLFHPGVSLCLLDEIGNLLLGHLLVEERKSLVVVAAVDRIQF